MSAQAPQPFNALLLAGGRSVRMGTDKALLEWQGRPLWEVQLEKLLSLHPVRTWIACRREQPLSPSHWLGDGAVLLYDPPGENLGPIGAITRALGEDPLPLLVLAVDTPLITVEFLRAAASRDRGFFHRSPHGIEPLPGLYTPAMRPLLEQAIRLQQFSLHRVIETAADAGLALIEPLAPHDAALFANTNTPEQWAQVQADRQPD